MINDRPVTGKAELFRTSGGTALPFCRHFGIKIDTTLKFTSPEIVGDALHLKLGETTVVGGRTRKKK
jgi:hypothetical protein